MKIIERLKTDRKFLLKVVGLAIATLVVPYLTIPGLMIWWFYKTHKISKMVKVIVMGLFGASTILLLVFGIAIYAKDLEPHLTVSEPSGNTKVQAKQITLKGNYDPPDRVVWVNSKRVPSTNGSFEAVYDLQEGENKIDVTAGKWKRAHVYLTVIRELTAEEIAAKTTPTSQPTTASVQEPTKAPTAVKQTTPTPQPTKLPQTPEQVIEAKIRASVKKRTNTDKDKIIEVRVNKAFDNDKEYVVFVSINADDNLSEDWIKKGIWGDMTDIYIALYKQPVGIRQAAIVANFPMKDKYGNTSDDAVMKTSLEANEAKKVNWNQDEATLSLQILPNVWDIQINLFK